MRQRPRLVAQMPHQRIPKGRLARRHGAGAWRVHNDALFWGVGPRPVQRGLGAQRRGQCALCCRRCCHGVLPDGRSTKAGARGAGPGRRGSHGRGGLRLLKAWHLWALHRPVPCRQLPLQHWHSARRPAPAGLIWKLDSSTRQQSLGVCEPALRALGQELDHVCPHLRGCERQFGVGFLAEGGTRVQDGQHGGGHARAKKLWLPIAGRRWQLRQLRRALRHTHLLAAADTLASTRATALPSGTQLASWSGGVGMPHPVAHGGRSGGGGLLLRLGRRRALRRGCPSKA